MIRIKKEYIVNQRGSVLIWGLISILILLLFFGLVVDRIVAYTIRTRANDSIQYALETGAKQHLVQNDNSVVFKRPEARATVYKYLKKNLELDDAFNPINAGSYIAGTVEIKELEFMDETVAAYPFKCPETGQVFNYPTIHIEMEIPVRFLFMKLFINDESLKMRIHQDVSTEDFL